MAKKTILTFVRWYLPGYKSGGPVRTIANMVDQLSDEFDFRVVTFDRDATDTEPYSNIQINEWNQIGKSQVFYASPGFLNFRNVVRLIRETEHDFLYLNSFWNPKFTVLPLLARRLGILPDKPVVLAPRGQFSQGALALKQLKKKVFLQASRATGLYRNIRWQASSEHEMESILKIIGAELARDIVIAPDLPKKPDTKEVINLYKPRKLNDPLRMIFLSRISPMKNLDFALKVLAKVNVSVLFDIYGVVDDGAYWEECKLLLSKLPSHVKVCYHGAIEHNAVHETLADYDLFFLPTRGENYGHTIFEALAAGTPVLITDQTPWSDLDEAGVGWVRSLNDEQGFVDVINQVARMDWQILAKQRILTRQYAHDLVKSGQTIKANKELFKQILS